MITDHTEIIIQKPTWSICSFIKSWTDVRVTSPQLSREATYKLSLENLTLQCTSSRQVLIQWHWCALLLFICLVSSVDIHFWVPTCMFIPATICLFYHKSTKACIPIKFYVIGARIHMNMIILTFLIRSICVYLVLEKIGVTLHQQLWSYSSWA